LWERTQEAFRKTNHPKHTKRDFAFIGMLTCAFCGCAITAEIKKGKYIYYHCTGNHGPCPKPAIRQETLAEKLGDVIKGIAIDEGLLDWLIQALRESHRDEKAYHDGMIACLQAQYDKLQHRIDQAYTDKLDGKIPEELFLRKMNEWREEQSKILSQIRAHQTANHNYLEEGIRILELANKAYSLYLRQPTHEKARLLKIVQSNCLWDGVSPCPEYRKPFDILAEGLSSANWLADVRQSNGPHFSIGCVAGAPMEAADHDRASHRHNRLFLSPTRSQALVQGGQARPLRIFVRWSVMTRLIGPLALTEVSMLDASGHGISRGVEAQ
jgi:hypothetical protein